jgi:DNA-binding MarR family transcriptional regulator
MSLKAQPANKLGYLLQHVAGVLHRQSDQVLQERLGIGISQFRILMMLEENPNVEQRRIADSLGQTEASISRQVKLLHDRAMLVTRINPEERRKHMTTPTPKGIKITEAAREILARYHEPLFGGLSIKEQDLLHGALTLLHESACAPGKPMACDRPFAIGTIYDNQKV